MSAVLEIEGARPASATSPISGAVTLRLMPGELALVQADDPMMARALVLLCTGLTPLAEGHVRFLGEDWAGLARPVAEARRGRIGLAPGDGGWLQHLTVAESMMLPRRHHDTIPDTDLRAEAVALCKHFGLPGLLLRHPSEIPRPALARAGCARALLGTPDLILLESPLDREVADALADPLLAALRPALDRGAAVLWSTRSRRAWQEPGFPATQWWRLEEEGLCPATP